MKKPDTKQRLEEALSEANPEERDALRAMWRLSANADEAPDISTEQVDALWQTLSAAASEPAAQPTAKQTKQDRGPAKRTHRKPVSRIWAGMAVAVLLVALGVMLWLRPVVKTAPYGEQATAYLPDGSKVELNSGSSIQYARSFNGNRAVTLKGEAYFDVVESTVPFTVQTFNAEVRVLGTTFNVKAWESGWRPESQVTLTSGSVRLSALQSPEKTMVMTPGQTVTVQSVTEDFVMAETENMDHLLAWRTGELVFKDQALVSVLEEVERRFGINVVLSANQLTEKEVTFAYRQATSAESVIEDLCHALDLQYRPISNGYELFEE